MGFSSSSPPPSSASTQNWLWVFRAGIGLILLATLLFLLGFFTKMWYDDSTVHYGLWRTCSGTVCEDIDASDLPAYRIATQAFQCLAFTAYGGAPVLHYLFYCTKQKKGFDIRTRVFDIIYGLGVLFHLASVLIYGLVKSEPKNFDWSFEMTAASVAINAVGLCLAAYSRHSALHDFSFCSHTGGKSKRARRIADSGNGRQHGPQRRQSHRQQWQQQQHFGGGGTSTSSQYSSQHPHPAPPVNVVVNNNISIPPTNNQQGMQPQSFAYTTNSSGAPPTALSPTQINAYPAPSPSVSPTAPPPEPTAMSSPAAWPLGAHNYPQYHHSGFELPPLRGQGASAMSDHHQDEPPPYDLVLQQQKTNSS